MYIHTYIYTYIHTYNTRFYNYSPAVLLVGTPQAFRIALNETEIWAVLTAEKGFEFDF